MPNSSQERRSPDRIRSMVIGTSSLSMGLVRGAGAQLQVPSAMGMILSGMLLRNVGGGLAIAGLEASWSKQIRAAALAIIFLRSGLEIDLDVSALHYLRGNALVLACCVWSMSAWYYLLLHLAGMGQDAFQHVWQHARSAQEQLAVL